MEYDTAHQPEGVKPLWEMKFDWSTMPPWVNYVARDLFDVSAKTVGFISKPTFVDNAGAKSSFWYVKDYEEIVTEIPPDYAPDYPEDLQSEDSLIVRPGEWA